jgi:hypothetical protein
MNPDSMDPGLVTPAGAQPISVRTVRAAMVAVGHDPADWALPPTGRPAIPDRLVSRDQECRLAEQLVDVLDRAIAAWSGEQTVGGAFAEASLPRVIKRACRRVAESYPKKP